MAPCSTNQWGFTLWGRMRQNKHACKLSQDFFLSFSLSPFISKKCRQNNFFPPKIICLNSHCRIGPGSDPPYSSYIFIFFAYSFCAIHIAHSVFLPDLYKVNYAKTPSHLFSGRTNGELLCTMGKHVLDVVWGRILACCVLKARGK